MWRRSDLLQSAEWMLIIPRIVRSMIGYIMNVQIRAIFQGISQRKMKQQGWMRRQGQKQEHSKRSLIKQMMMQEVNNKKLPT